MSWLYTGTVDGTKTPLNVEKAGIELIEFISITEVDTHCIIFSKDDALVVAFRGTASSVNAGTDMKAQLSDICWTSMEANTRHTCEVGCDCRRSRIRVHAGFMRSFTAIRRRVLSRIQCLVDMSDPDIPTAHTGGLNLGQYDREDTCPAYIGKHDDETTPPTITNNIINHIYICGHSLGGALATLFAYQCAQLLPDVRLSVYTFGSPRVGNGYFANAYDHLVPDTHRIVNDGDPVTSVPKFIWLKIIDLAYKHVGVVYIINAKGDIVVDPSFMERFVMVKPKYNLTSHLTGSYRKSIAAVIVNSVRHSNAIDATCGLCAALQTITAVLQAPSEMCRVQEQMDVSAQWLSASIFNIPMPLTPVTDITTEVEARSDSHNQSQHRPFDTRSLAEEAIERVTAAPRAFSEDVVYVHGKSDSKKSSISRPAHDDRDTIEEGHGRDSRQDDWVGCSSGGGGGDLADHNTSSSLRMIQSSQTSQADVNNQTEGDINRHAEADTNRQIGRRQSSTGLHRGIGVRGKRGSGVGMTGDRDKTIAHINTQQDDHG